MDEAGVAQVRHPGGGAVRRDGQHSRGARAVAGGLGLRLGECRRRGGLGALGLEGGGADLSLQVRGGDLHELGSIHCRVNAEVGEPDHLTDAVGDAKHPTAEEVGVLAVAVRLREPVGARRERQGPRSGRLRGRLLLAPHRQLRAGELGEELARHGTLAATVVLRRGADLAPMRLLGVRLGGRRDRVRLAEAGRRLRARLAADPHQRAVRARLPLDRAVRVSDDELVLQHALQGRERQGHLA
mmetsp:Transcript_18302/g.49106  ORF Transcript_18302/g.49106 Transcript_18302/m.49106 type:complete len:242 (+) Transcript_18302:966-1691(+)